jgi:negative regulator of replication initiation
MSKIPPRQTTEKFQVAVKKFQDMKEEALTVVAVNQIMKEMRETFNSDIKPREFSIENFWRALAKLFRKDLSDAPIVSHIR